MYAFHPSLIHFTLLQMLAVVHWSLLNQGDLAYRNEAEVGQGIKESGLARKDIYVTTKWSRVDEKMPRQSCEESLDMLGLEYVDLYLIHAPRHCRGDIPGTWKQMEELYKLGYAKRIGVSK